MSDYNQTRDAAGVITSRFGNMLRNLSDEQEEHRMENNMDVSDVIKNVMGTSAAVEIMNELVLATLVSSRDTCIAERDRLKDITDQRDMTDYEAEDWSCLVFDIYAFNRVIEYYGG
jgi:hypothetical protein